MKSVFITGAPGVGKSTTYNQLINEGFVPSPTHLTREPRLNEIDGVDAVFLTVEAFKRNLQAGFYLESSLDQAEHLGVYYGSPGVWGVPTAPHESPFVATPSNTVIVEKLCSGLQTMECRDSVVWVNLLAPIEVRRARMEVRGYEPSMLHQRLTMGVSQGYQIQADLNIDTSQHNVHSVVDLILSEAIA